MNATISLVMHCLVIISIATLGFGAACALIVRPFLRWSDRFDPRSRLFLLRLFAAWPLLAGLGVGVMVSLPSINHASKLPFDHCHNPGGCLIQPVSHMLTTSEFVIITLLLGLLAWAIVNAFLQWRRADSFVKQIDIASHATLASGVRLIETALPLAFSLGLCNTISVLSTGLVRVLTPRQLNIICVHEQAHLHHHDNAYKWMLRSVCVFHLPHVRRAVLSEHAFTLELRADQHVAQHIQDPIAVAETIVAMQRLIKPFNGSELVCQFAGTALERRVQYLLAPPATCRLPTYMAVLCLLTAIIVTASGSAPLHNALEALLV